jgi:hypothetical protein
MPCWRVQVEVLRPDHAVAQRTRRVRRGEGTVYYGGRRHVFHAGPVIDAPDAETARAKAHDILRGMPDYVGTGTVSFLHNDPHHELGTTVWTSIKR